MFWRRKSISNNTYYSGSNAGRHLDELLKHRGSLLIVSPYIDAYYAKILLKLSGRRKINVITSSADEDALKLLGKGGSVLWIAAYVLLSVLILYAMGIAGITGYYLLIALIPVMIGTLKHWRIRRNISLKVPKRFVHVKMYIAEGMAMTGSANLTYKGMHKNVEHVTVTYSEDEIKKLRAQFWEMWNDA